MVAPDEGVETFGDALLVERILGVEIEPALAVADLAALLKERGRMRGKRVGLVLSGGNIDRALFAEVLARADGAAEEGGEA